MEHSNRHVGLFGGSFNPPHICHLLSSIYLLEAGQVDEVWWLPVHQHAFAKDESLAPWEDRLAMARAVAARQEGLQIVDIEARLAPPSYTFDTVSALRAEHPGTRFSWVIGSDLLGELTKWHRWEELRDSLDFLVVGRGEEPSAPPPGARFHHLDFRLPDISSTDIRRRLLGGEVEALRPLLPSAVFTYLEAHPELYR